MPFGLRLYQIHDLLTPAKIPHFFDGKVLQVIMNDLFQSLLAFGGQLNFDSNSLVIEFQNAITDGGHDNRPLRILYQNAAPSRV